MVFVERNPDRSIKGVYANAEPEYAEEDVPDGDPDVIAFRARAFGLAAARKVPKSLIVQRLIDAGKIVAAKAALDANPAHFARWFAPDHPTINADDQDAIALLQAIGADPAEILAP